MFSSMLTTLGTRSKLGTLQKTEGSRSSPLREGERSRCPKGIGRGSILRTPATRRWRIVCEEERSRRNRGAGASPRRISTHTP